MKHPQLAVIADLVKPFLNESKIDVKTIENATNHNLESVIEKHSINVENLKYSGVNDDPSWKFVCLCLLMLKELKEKISSAEKVEDELISLTDRKEILSCVEIVISLGLVPYLLPGVGIPVKSQLRCVEHLQDLQSLTDFQKYERLCVTVRSLVYLKDEFIFHSVLIPRFFNDLLAALFQLCFVPLKKPTENISASSEEAVTPAMWCILQADRQEFSQKLESLIVESHQPSVIREIMIIQGNKMCPKWLKLACSKLLSERLTEAGGLKATVSALCDTDFDSSITWKKLDVITRIITSPSAGHAETYFDKIMPQFLEALCLPVNKENKLACVMKQVSIRCIKLIAETPTIPESRQLLQQIMQPFLCPTASTPENKISSCIADLLTCCTFSDNEMFRVPPRLMIPIIYRLFLALMKLSDSPLMLKNDVKELIYCIIYDLREDETTLYGVLFMCLLNDISYCDKNCVLDLKNLKFELGDSGGVCFKEGCDEVFIDETSSIIIELLMEKDSERLILKKFFVRLLTIVAEGDSIVSNFEQNLVVIKTLSILGSDEKIQSIISENPKLIVDFIKSVLSENSNSSNIETTCLGLMILDVILSNISASSVCLDQSYFKTLIKPLSKTLETTQNEEVRSLVERIIGLINKQVDKDVGSSKYTTSDKLVSKIDSRAKPAVFQEAMHDVCDALLPVRAHGIMQLTKLIRSKDKEALAKKDILFCLFKESLKHEDSYLYLSAVDGLACLAAELPDSVLITLIDEYTTNNNPELRLKVGETLVKTTKTLVLVQQVTSNEYGEKKEKFRCILALMFVQCVLNCVFAKIILTVKDQGTDTTRTGYYIGSAATYTLAMFFSYKALQWVSYPTQVIAKSGKPIPVMVLGVLLGRKSYPLRKYVFVLLVVIGIIVFVYKDPKNEGLVAESSYGLGELLLVISLTMDGLLGAVQERMRSESQTKFGYMMLNMNTWAVLFVGIGIFAAGEMFAFIDFVQKYPEIIPGISVLALTCSMGQVFIFLTVSEFGPLPCSIITTSRKFFSVLVSVFFVGKGSLLPRQWVALVVVFLGLFLDTTYNDSPSKAVSKPALTKGESTAALIKEEDKD